jgi:hypothetical protein
MHRIVRLHADAPSTLTLWWQDGSRTTLDLASLIAIGGELADLRDPTVLASARVELGGRALVFDRPAKHPIDLCADALWRTAHGDASVAAEARDGAGSG